jgi:hypothetical protein
LGAIEHAYHSRFVNDIAGQEQRPRAVSFDIARGIECRVFIRHVIDSDRPPTRGRQYARGSPDAPRAAGYKKVWHGLMHWITGGPSSLTRSKQPESEPRKSRIGSEKAGKIDGVCSGADQQAISGRAKRGPEQSSGASWFLRIAF